MKPAYYLYIFLSIIVFGCETTEKIDDFPLRPSKLVVNCYFNADSIWEFQVSKSLSVLDNAPLKVIKNASIRLFSEGVLLDTINTMDEDGFYRSTENLPEEGREYSIEVSSPGFKDVLNAKDITPIKPSITNVNVVITDSVFYSYDAYYNYGHVKGSFEITFPDQKGVSNYYQFKAFYIDSLFYYYEKGPVFSHLERRYVSVSSEDISVENSTEYGNIVLINDHIYDGQDYTFSLDFEEWSAKKGIDYYLELTSLTREGFLYRKSINEYDNSRNDPFSEPVIIYSNVNNGFGIFSGFSSNLFKVSNPF
jgi:hypothetical protein